MFFFLVLQKGNCYRLRFQLPRNNTDGDIFVPTVSCENMQNPVKEGQNSLLLSVTAWLKHTYYSNKQKRSVDVFSIECKCQLDVRVFGLFVAIEHLLGQMETVEM